MLPVILLTAVFALTPVKTVLAGPVCRNDAPPCRGCGCRGGPGYRGPNGKCVSFKRLRKACGSPPTKRCVFENAPGTGANRKCALHEHNKLEKK